jgi:predicted component of type VI protein secretion system
MTVKCLDTDQKNFIAAGYRERVFSSEELALQYGVSKRTINRVLVECGVNRIRHCKPRYKDNSTMELPIKMFEPNEIVIDESPAPKPQPQPEPFIKRLWVFVKHALSFPFK